MKPSTVGYHRILLIGGHRVKPSPLTLIPYPPTGMGQRIASSDRIHPHNGYVVCTYDIVPFPGPLLVRPGAAGLLIGIKCSRVMDSAWMYLTFFVTTRIGVELAVVQENYLTLFK